MQSKSSSNMLYNENVGEATHSLLRTPSMRVALRDVQNTKPLLSSGAKRIVQSLTPAGKNPEPNILSTKTEKGSYMKPTEAYKYVFSSTFPPTFCFSSSIY